MRNEHPEQPATLMFSLQCFDPANCWAFPSHLKGRSMNVFGTKPQAFALWSRAAAGSRTCTLDRE